MSALNTLGIAEARDALNKGDITSVDLTKACLSAIEAAAAVDCESTGTLFACRAPNSARNITSATTAETVT